MKAYRAFFLNANMSSNAPARASGPRARAKKRFGSRTASHKRTTESTKTP